MVVESLLSPVADAVTVIWPGRSVTLIRAVAIPASALIVAGLTRKAGPVTEKVTLVLDAVGTNVPLVSSIEAYTKTVSEPFAVTSVISNSTDKETIEPGVRTICVAILIRRAALLLRGLRSS